jgi:hypothetical protein
MEIDRFTVSIEQIDATASMPNENRVPLMAFANPGEVFCDVIGCA